MEFDMILQQHSFSVKEQNLFLFQLITLSLEMGICVLF